MDLAANVASLGASVIRASTVPEFREALREALAAKVTTAVYVRADPLAPSIPGGAWWDVPIAEVSALDSTKAARRAYESDAEVRRDYL